VSKRASYREGVGFGALSFGAMGMLGIASSIAIARVYGVNVLGQFALVMAPVNAAWFLSTVKERPGFVAELASLHPRHPRVTGLFLAVFAFSFVLTLLVGSLALVASYFLFKGPVGHPELIAPTAVNLAGYVFITNTCFNYDTVLSGFRAGRQLFWLRLHQAVAFLAVAVALGFVWGDVWGLVVATIASWFTTLIHRLVVIRPFMHAWVSREEIREGMKTLREIITFGLKITPGGIFDGISNEAGTWVLGIFSSVNTVGAYNRAWTLGRRFMELNWRISEMLFPTLVERRAKGDAHGFDRALVDSLRYSAAGMLLPAAAAGGAAYGVMSLFGPGFEGVTGALTLILLMPATSTISSLQRHALYAVNRPVTASASATIRLVVTVGLCVPLSLLVGTTGTAAAVVLGFAADSAYMFRVTRGHLATPLLQLWPLRSILAIAGAYAAGFAAARVVYDMLETVPGLIVALAAGSVAYAGVFAMLGGVHKRDVERFASLWERARERARRRGSPGPLSTEPTPP